VSTSAAFHDFAKRVGDRTLLFSAVADTFAIERVLYPGSYIDLAPSFFFPSVTYIDIDKRAAEFFADTDGVERLVKRYKKFPGPFDVKFHHADYAQPLPGRPKKFDLIISMYAGFAAAATKRYLKKGGWLLADDSHGDASLAKLDPAFRLVAAVQDHYGQRHRLDQADLDTYLVAKNPSDVTPEVIRKRGRGAAYTRFASAYVFERTR
jgi:hypothetical protein